MLRHIKNWSGWSTAGSIFLARMEAVFWFLIGCAAFVDWNSLINASMDPGFTRNTMLSVAVPMAIKAVIAEITRRHGARDLDYEEKQ